MLESSTPFSRTMSVCVMHASVRQSKMHATASSGNSISHPTEQSRHFDTHDGFFLLLLLYFTLEDEEVDDDDDDDEDDAVGFEEELLDAKVTIPFEVDAP